MSSACPKRRAASAMVSAGQELKAASALRPHRYAASLLRSSLNNACDVQFPLRH